MRYKNNIIIITLMAFGIWALPSLLADSDRASPVIDLEQLSVSGSFGFESQHVFRGKQFAWQSFQPGVELSYPVAGGEVYTGVWSNQQLDNKNAAGVPGGRTEVDFYAGYIYPITDTFSLDAGFTYYLFTNQPNALQRSSQSRELYVGLTADVLLSPSVYVYYDFDQSQTVVEASIGYTLHLDQYADIVAGLRLEATAYAGTLSANRYLGVQGAKNGYNYAGASLDIVYDINENLSTYAGIRGAVNNDGSTMNQGGREVNIWYGVGLAYAF